MGEERRVKGKKERKKQSGKADRTRPKLKTQSQSNLESHTKNIKKY